MNIKEIYIPLLNEGTATSWLTYGKQITDEIFEVLPSEDYDPEDEIWKFLPGTFVKCRTDTWQNQPVLIACCQVENAEK